MARTNLMSDNLTAEERIIAEYIEANASDVLVEKINSGDKGIKDCWNFIIDQAKEKANGQSGIGIADSVVFGWAIHYFEEDSIKKGETPKVKVEVKAVEPKKVEKKPDKKAEKPKEELLPGQMTIFDLMG